MANNDFAFPTTPRPSALMPQREVNFADPSFIETEPSGHPSQSSIFKPVNLTRPENTNLSNAPESQDYDFSVFNSYIHYGSNPNGGQGLLDQTSYEIRASIIYSRPSGPPTVTSPYG